jgi:hypothetical protein
MSCEKAFLNDLAFGRVPRHRRRMGEGWQGGTYTESQLMLASSLADLECTLKPE